MQRYGNTVLSSVGLPLSGVSVTVKLAGTGTLATLFSANGSGALANPFINETDGSFNFYAANGRYDISFVLAGYTFDETDFTDELLFDFVDVFTGKGVIPIGTGAGTYVLQAVGDDRYMLVYDSTQAAGVRAKNPWANSYIVM